MSRCISETGTGQPDCGAAVVVVGVVATVVDVDVEEEVDDVVDVAGGVSPSAAHAVKSKKITAAIRTMLTVAAIAAAACGGTDAPTMRVAAVPTITSVAPTTTALPTTTTTRRPTTTALPRPVTIDAPGNQAIVVRTGDYGDTSATLMAYTRTSAGWKPALGPWPAFVGRKGIAPPGEKREGDGRTPSGTYGFDFAFGIDENPGVKLPYRVITGPNIVWVEDPNSPNYNRWVDANTEDIGNQADNMYQPPYRYGVVIAYNTRERTPGLGSAIFLHITTGRPTAGCVSLPADRLLRILRWLDPAQSPVIVIGPQDATS